MCVLGCGFLVSFHCMSDIRFSEFGESFRNLLEFCCRGVIVVHLEEVEDDLSEGLEIFETSW